MTAIRLLLAFYSMVASVAACPLSLFSTTPSYPISRPHNRPLQLTGPHRCVDNVCVYADPLYGGGSGIAVVTTAENAALLEGLPHHRGAAATTHVTDPPPFYEAYVAGKGLGLVANSTIRRGDQVMLHGPTLLVHWETHAKAAGAQLDGLYEAATQRLPAAARRRFQRQMHMGGSGVYANIETNCFRLFLDGGRDEATGHLGCFPAAARLNHDCRPKYVPHLHHLHHLHLHCAVHTSTLFVTTNCRSLHYHVHGITQTVVAVRDIEPGDELTVSYVDVLLSRAERQARLRDWGFACACALCRNDTAAAERDTQTQEILALRARLDRGDPSTTANSGIELAILYEDARLDTLVGQQAYTRAALNCALFAEEACAVAFAHKAMEALVVEAGEQAGDLASMWRLATSPQTHWAWGLRARA
ncbi:hypothetical protein SPBR_05042 [Sporothrix brasiliensis 5110]|uniref:SET domain-containing protein n=1 Tax=Sporothrix brasiliensis 5110 TaxID=1398154 RepID=A0A0C2IJE8_9PEZI|nr:uncharacterized protein SPBR_05042 [Sporothrix brasiliensis 5110]KIH87080.1 hypothetical protein SPBR_05042 [Sporothrix brasiliensis 5110]